MDAESYLRTDDECIPTGEFVSVEGTPFDFRIPKKLGKDMHADYVDLKSSRGYDHCFNFTNWQKKCEEPIHRITLSSLESGIEMKLLTDQPCVQIYGDNYNCPEKYEIKNKCVPTIHKGVCLETQIMPDSINHSGFTNSVLDVSETYRQTTILRFNVIL